MPETKESLNLGDLLKYEAPNLYSRDRVTVPAGQHLHLGTVVGQVTSTLHIKPIDPSATDGSQYAAGVMMQSMDALAADRDNGLMIARHAIVANHALSWPAAMTQVERQAATQQLKALGILVRQGV